jgi:hypothetical protein
MKKIYLLSCALSLATIAVAQVDPNVSTTVQKPNVLIEEFTGIHCGFCPDGHRVAQEIVKNNPGKAFTIAVHAGGFANPQDAADEDLRINAAAVLDRLGFKGSTSSSYPSAMFNRHKFASKSILNVNARAEFPQFADSIMKYSGNAPANIGITAVVDANSRILKVRCQVYYTASTTTTTNRLHLALTESEIITIQSNYGPGAGYNPSMITSDGRYRQQHVLRDMLTGADGILISGTNSASGKMMLDTTIAFTIPQKYAVNTAGYVNTPVNLGELEVVALLTSGSTIVSSYSGSFFKFSNVNTYSECLNVNGAHVSLITGVEKNKASINAIEVYPNPASEFVTINTQLKDAVIEIYNVLGERVYCETPQNTSAKVSISTFTPGVYFVKVTAASVTESTKLVKE